MGFNIVLNGSGFQNGAGVSVSGTGVTVSSTTFNSPSQITATINVGGSAATGTRDITVANPDAGTGTGLGLLTITAAPPPGPIVFSINPATGTNNGIANISTVTGDYFQSGATVKLTKTGQSDILGSGFAFANSTTINGGSFNLTGAATGTWNVMVTNPDSQSGVLAGGFTVNSLPPPSLSSISPASTTQGTVGLNVTVNGSDFQNGALVSFSGTGVITNNTSFVSASQLTVNIDVSGSAPTGARDVTVTNPDGGSAAGTGMFTIIAVQQNTGYLMGSGTPTLTLSGNWTAPDNWYGDEEPPPGTTQIAQATFNKNNSPSVLFKGFSLGIPAGSTIDGICVLLDDVSISSSPNGPQYWSVALTWDGGTSFTPENTFASDVVDTTLGGIEQFYKDQSSSTSTGDPGTACTGWGRGWAANEMSSVNFGVRAATNSNSTQSVQLRFDVIKVKVYYTPQ